MKRCNSKILLEKYLILIIVIFLSTPAFAIQGYETLDLGTLDGKFIKISPKAINTLGQIVGVGFWWDSGGVEHSQGFIWDSTIGMREIEGFGDYNFPPVILMTMVKSLVK